jgi:DNA-binding response OmpR family regulator
MVTSLTKTKQIVLAEDNSADDANPNAGPIDLLLLVVLLPNRNGEEILKRLRSSDHCAQTPVVVMGASDAPRVHSENRGVKK